MLRHNRRELACDFLVLLFLCFTIAWAGKPSSMTVWNKSSDEPMIALLECNKQRASTAQQHQLRQIHHKGLDRSGNSAKKLLRVSEGSDPGFGSTFYGPSTLRSPDSYFLNRENQERTSATYQKHAGTSRPEEAGANQASIASESNKHGLAPHPPEHGHKTAKSMPLAEVVSPSEGIDRTTQGLKSRGPGRRKTRKHDLDVKSGRQIMDSVKSMPMTQAQVDFSRITAEFAGLPRKHEANPRAHLSAPWPRQTMQFAPGFLDADLEWFVERLEDFMRSYLVTPGTGAQLLPTSEFLKTYNRLDLTALENLPQHWNCLGRQIFTHVANVSDKYFDLMKDEPGLQGSIDEWSMDLYTQPPWFLADDEWPYSEKAVKYEKVMEKVCKFLLLQAFIIRKLIRTQENPRFVATKVEMDQEGLLYFLRMYFSPSQSGKQRLPPDQRILNPNINPDDLLGIYELSWSILEDWIIQGKAQDKLYWSKMIQDGVVSTQLKALCADANHFLLIAGISNLDEVQLSSYNSVLPYAMSKFPFLIDGVHKNI